MARIAHKLPADLDEIASLGASDWLIAQADGASTVSKLHPGAITYDKLGSSAAAGAMTMDWYAKNLLLPDNGVVGAFVSSAWSSALAFSTTKLTVRAPYLSVRNTADSAYAEIYSSNVRLMVNGSLIGYHTGSAWSSAIYFSSTETEIRTPSLSVRNVADSAYASIVADDISGAEITGTHFKFNTTNYQFQPATNTWGIVVNGTQRYGIGTGGSLLPSADNSYTLGASGYRMSAIWAATGTIQTSDARDKTDVTDSDLGLDFILALRPVSYRWIVGGNDVTPGATPDDPSIVTPRPGVRTHYGLLAQDVRATLDDLLGSDGDFGGWIKDADTGIEGLRYDQFIAPLIKAVQELAARVKELEAQLGV